MRADSNATTFRVWVEGVAFHTFTVEELGCAGGSSLCTTPSPLTLPLGSRTWAVQGANASGYGQMSVALSITAGYQHSISIDGINDFTAGETFSTTSGSYSAYVTWDSTNLYVGYLGSDIASNDPAKWVLIYLDTKTGGTATGVTYNTQAAGFPAGFEADYHIRWKANDSYRDAMSFTSTWSSTSMPGLTSYRNGSFVEFAIPFASVGSPLQIGVTAFMINEQGGGEWSYAGLYSGTFSDGYHSTLPISKYLLVSRDSPSLPNAAGNTRP